MKLILAYKRRPELVDDTHLFDGYLQENKLRLKLEGKTFAELIFELSNRLLGLVLTSHDEVAMIRLEQPTVVHPLNDDEVEMIRNHPSKYIEALSPPPRRIVLKVSDQVSVDASMTVGIRSGIDTLVDAFGNYVYIKLRVGGSTECPACGRWKAMTMVGSNGFGETRCYGDDGCGFFAPSKCLPLEWGGWAGIKVEILLGIDAIKRFYLPRIWNTSGPWITYEDLREKYDKYIKEKENADR